MSSTFTDEIADFLLQKGDLKGVTLVIPNKRAVTYISKSLSKKIKGPIWMPEIKTLTEWIDERVASRIISSTESIILLYQAYQKVLGSDAESFSDFFKWGNMLKNDFNEIEVYLLNHKDVYRNLKDIKEIEEWSFGEKELTPYQEKYLAFWQELGAIYEGFKEILEAEHCMTYGSALRWVAENMPLIEEKNASDFYVFAGFNAFSEAEKQIIDFWIKKDKVKIFWDVDSFYVDNKEHEAGHFYREGRRKWSEKHLNSPYNLISKYLQKCDVIGVPQNTMQARLAASLLDEIPEEEYAQTAVILGDEKLLDPLLAGIPPTISQLNVTMGMSLKNTPLKSLMDALFNIQINYYKYKSFGKGVYYKDWFTLMRHPYMKSLFPKETQNIDAINLLAVRKNFAFLREQFLKEHGYSDLLFLIKPWRKDKIVMDAMNTLNSIIEKAEKWIVSKNLTFEAQLFSVFKSGINDFNELLERYNLEVNLSVYRSLFQHFWQNEKVAYEGSPIEDIQVMGLLETRMLDFKNIIFVSMNEDVIPKKSREQSLMPIDLKKYFNLPTKFERDAIFAHHFYRLLHRAENVTLIYNTETDEMGGGERSRFITQLEFELPQKSIAINQLNQFSFFSEVPVNTDFKIEKTPEMVDRILEYLCSGVSPTALNTYFSCPMDFYYRYVLNLGEEDEVEETFSFSTFGTIIHDTLEVLYKDFEGKWLRAENIEQMLKFYESTLLEQSKKHFDTEYLSRGANHLYFEAAKSYLYRYLKEEQKWLQKSPCFLIKLEENLSIEKEYKVNGKKVLLSLKGKADRIDRVGETTRIIDYKSGKVDEKELNIHIDKKPKPKALQLGIYYMMYHENVENLIAGNISLQKPEDGLLHITIGKEKEEVSQKIMNEFLDAVLQEFLNELLDVSIPFVHNTSSEYCSYCD